MKPTGSIPAMFLATLLISGRDWLIPAASFLVVASLVLIWAYRNAPAGGGVRTACVLLKLLGILALAACLLEPLWSTQRARPGANLFVILADNSQGMGIKDRGDARTRGESLRGLVTGAKTEWQATMEENFQLRRYIFDSRLQATKDFGDLVFDGRASSIGSALRTLADRYKGQPLAGVLLLSDGNATDLGDRPLNLDGLPPVYPIVIGRDEPAKDIAVNNVTVSQTSFEDAPVSIQGDVTTLGYEGQSIVAQLVEVGTAFSPAQHGTNAAPPRATNSSGKAVAEKIISEQTLRAPRDGEPLAFRFQIRPEKAGVLFYRLRASPQAELEPFAKTGASAEATLANNSRVLVVDRGQGPYRILYVSGRPNWEFKFLNRALAEDDQVQLVALIRVAKREPKFTFRGRAGETVNPLFRGFDDKSKEETERFDKPVLVRLNTRDQFELAGGFPKTAEELFAYHAVVLDDLEAEFFTPDQMLLLQKFVSERGGGFLMLGGTESFHEGKFNRTPIGDMLPVYIDQTAENKPVSGLRFSFTREGWLQPWARLRNNESDEKTRLDAMPPFEVMNRVRGIKPGASVLASVTDAAGESHPALAVQRFGNGRAAALMVGDLWRWGLRDETLHRDMDKAWRQMMRWLVADVPGRVTLQTEQKRDDPNQAVVLQVRARDKKFQPLDNANVSVSVRFVGQDSALNETNRPTAAAESAARTNVIRLTAEASVKEAGLYEAIYVPRESGGYRAEAVVTDAAGVEVDRVAAGWSCDPAAEEFRSLKPNRSLMEEIAKKTGGEIITADQLEAFATSLPHRNVPIKESWTRPFWHQPAVFLFALACFVAEWAVRRLRGLV